MKVNSAEVILKWDNGRTVKMGTLDIEYTTDENDLKYKNRIKLRQRLGWELVRAGFRVMFPFREWKTETT